MNNILVRSLLTSLVENLIKSPFDIAGKVRAKIGIESTPDACKINVDVKASVNLSKH